MLTTNPAEILRGKYELLGGAKFAEQIRSAVRAEIGGNGGTRELLRKIGDDYPRLYYSVLADIRDGKLVPTNAHFHKLAHMLDDVGVEIDINISLRPWGELACSSRAVVLVAHKQSNDNGLSRPSLAVCDASSEDKVRVIKNRLGMGFSVEREFVPGNLTPDQAGELLDHWSRQPGVKMIVSTSSDQRNPVSAVIADRVCLGKPLPMRFRWTKSPQRASAISHPKPGRTSEIGIATEHHVLLRRHVDEEFVGKAKPQSIRDCGLLLIDCESDPMLIVSAGHGGNGTLGCLDVLWEERHRISSHLIKSNRGIAAVGVELKRHPQDHLEDLEIRKVWIEDWVDL